VALEEATQWMGRMLLSRPEAALVGATPYLRLFGIATGGVYLARGALAAVRRSDEADNAILMARFFAENIATAAPGLAETVMGGAEVLLGVRGEQLMH
jgi:hypothetical protein